MNKLLYALYILVFIVDYLSTKVGLLSRYFSWLPEILSIITIMIIPVLFMFGGGKNIPPKCAFFLILFIFNIIIGAILNLVPAGPLIAGLRSYLKPIPFFILPFLYHFSEQQINKQLKLIFFFFIIQAPIALYQRLVLSSGLLTGDAVIGTFSGSGYLTVMLSCAIAMLMSFYFANKISIAKFVVVLSLFFIPMTINETKATLILLPIALILPLIFSSEGIKMKNLIPVIAIGIGAGVAFVLIYDYFMRPRWGYGILDFLTEGKAESYLYKGTEISGESEPVGKVDSYVLAFKTLFENSLNLLFGLGIGNVRESFIPGLSGEYAQKYGSYTITSLSIILWELGLFGAVLYYFFFFMAFKDARQLSRQDSLVGVLANGWSVIAVLMMFSTAYINVILENATSYLFWYFSGYIISENYRYKRIRSKSYG